MFRYILFVKVKILRCSASIFVHLKGISLGDLGGRVVVEEPNGPNGF